MHTDQQPDLLARIATECSLTRSEARKVLRDLIDYHKRSVVSTVGGNGVRLTRYLPPIDTVSYKPQMFNTRKPNPVVSQLNPHSSSQDIKQLNNHRPAFSGRRQDISKRKLEPFVILPNGTQVRKTNFIIDLWRKGKTHAEIVTALCKLMEPKPDETPYEFRKRVSKRVGVTLSTERRNTRQPPKEA